MTQPTPDDIRRAELRQQYADKFRAEYSQAEAYALSLFGPGWTPHGKHSIVTNDEADAARKENRRPIPVVSVISVRRGGEERHFTVTDGTATACGPYTEAFADLLAEKHPTKPAYKHQVHWGWFENARQPQTAEQLAAARGRRQQKTVEREAEGNLFADAVRAEGPVKRGRSR